MTLQMLNAGRAGARYEASESRAPPRASWMGVPPAAPLPTNDAMIMKTTEEMTATWRPMSLPSAVSGVSRVVDSFVIVRPFARGQRHCVPTLAAVIPSGAAPHAPAC